MDCLERLLESTKVARLLGVEVQTLGVWRRKGYGPRWYRIGKKVKYAEHDLNTWINAQACTGSSIVEFLQQTVTEAVQPEGQVGAQAPMPLPERGRTR